MRGRTWVYNPHAGGVKVPPAVRERTAMRILAHAEKHYAGQYTGLGIRFRGPLCYIDAFTEPIVPSARGLKSLGETHQQFVDRRRRFPMHLCRLRYFGDENAWSLAFYTHSGERYEPCTFGNGRFHGTPEQGFEVGAIYLESGGSRSEKGPRHAR